MSTKTKRIAALFRELAEAFDDLEQEQRPRPRQARENLNRASEESARLVRERLRKEGIKVA